MTAQHFANLLLGGVGPLAQELLGRHQNAWRAVTALQGVVAPEGFLQVAQRAVFRGEVANRLDGPASRLNGKRQTAASRSSIDQDRARTANAVFAAD